MEIRKLWVQDWSDVYSLWKNCEGVGLRETDDSQNGFESFIKRNPDTCFAAFDDNCVLCATILAGNDGRRGYIYHLAVAEKYRNKGIGSQLLEKAINALGKCGIRKAALVVFSHNETGNEFWEKHGFKARRDLIYRDMELNL